MWINRRALTLAQLKAIPIPKRENVGRVWKGLKHSDLAEALLQGAKAKGLVVAGQHYYVNPAKTDVFGRLDFDKLPGIRSDKEFGFSAGFLSSNVGRTSVRILSGATVWACTNGMVVADHVLSKKHTTNLNINDHIDAGLDAYLQGSRELVKVRDRLQNLNLKGDNEKVANKLLVSAELGFISHSAIGKVYRNWVEPFHACFDVQDGWSLYNAFTEYGKTMSARNNSGLLRGLPSVFPKEFGLPKHRWLW